MKLVNYPLFIVLIFSLLNNPTQSKPLFHLQDSTRSHIVTEVSISTILLELANGKKNDSLQLVLQQVEAEEETSVSDFMDTFFEKMEEVNLSLGAVFVDTSPFQLQSSLFNKDSELFKKSPIAAPFLIPPSLFQPSEDELEQSLMTNVYNTIYDCRTVIQMRLKKFGVTPYVDIEEGTNHIHMSVPQRVTKSVLQSLLDQHNKLQFVQACSHEELQGILRDANKVLVEAQGASTFDTKSELLKLLKDNPHKFVYDSTSIDTINTLLNQENIISALPYNLRFAWYKSDDDGDYELIALKKSKRYKIIEGQHITDAKLDYDQFGRLAISITFNTEGTRILRKLTQNIGQRLAIVLDDDQIYSAPVINDVIPDGRVMINGNFNRDEAQEFVDLFNTSRIDLSSLVHIVEVK